MQLNYVKLTQWNWRDLLYVGQVVSHSITQENRAYIGSFSVISLYEK